MKLDSVRAQLFRYSDGVDVGIDEQARSDPGILQLCDDPRNRVFCWLER